MIFKLKHSHILYLLSLVLVLTGCRSDEEEGPAMMEMPISIVIPATDNLQTRAPGDPGLSTTLAKPTDAYVFLIYNQSNNNIGTDRVLYQHYTLIPSKWVKEIYAGDLATTGNEVYRYTGDLTISIPEIRSNGRVYAAVSTAALDINTGVTTEEQVMGLTFNVTSGLQDCLCDLYSTPYNYHGTGSTYYGIVQNFTSKVPSVDLLLYHVASKIDIIWNVDESFQANNAIKEVAALKLKKNACYLFKPTENKWTSTDESDNYNLTETTDVGNQWYGRTSFYAIPYEYPTGNTNEGKFDINLRFKTETATTGYNLTFRKDIAAEKTTHSDMNIFVPWIRGEVEFSKDITDGTHEPIEN